MSPELRAALRLVVEAYPAGMHVTLLREHALELLDGAGSAGIPGQERTLPPADLDVKAFASRMQRSPSTCRAWIEAGRVEGAYQARGRWRIPVASVLAFEDAERKPKPPAPSPRGKHDLSSWRRTA